jgi:hypothetical protein
MLQDRVPIFIYNHQNTDALGSIAVQALIPARHIGAKALLFTEEMDAQSFLDRQRPGALVITKSYDGGPLKLAREAQARGIPVIAMFCDLKPNSDDRNRKLADVADVLVASTASNAEYARRQFQKECLVIEEPVDMPRLPPNFSPREQIKLLYTGHYNNHDTLAPGIRKLAKFDGAKLSLLIVSNAEPDIRAFQQIAPNIRFSFLPWSPITQHAAFAGCDAVFVPSLDNDRKQTKGQLRVLYAIQSGKIAIAHPLEQYLELKDYCYCGEDYAELLRSALSNPSETVDRISKGQSYIDQRFSPEIVADRWETLINRQMLASLAYQAASSALIFDIEQSKFRRTGGSHPVPLDAGHHASQPARPSPCGTQPEQVQVFAVCFL